MGFAFRIITFCGLICCAVTAVSAQTMQGVGRLEHADGTAFCTATLVAPEIVLTAAHCVAKWQGIDIKATGEVRFRTGQLRAADAVRAAGIVLHPLYRRASNDLHRLRFDLALVRLEEQVDEAVSQPLPAGKEAKKGERLFIVSWRSSDGGTPRQKACGVLEGHRGLVTLDCAVWGGESGSPVLRRSDDGLEIVALISSRGSQDNKPTAIASDVALRLPALLQELGRVEREEGS